MGLLKIMVFLFYFPCTLADKEKEQNSQSTYQGPEADLFLYWGNRKRLAYMCEDQRPKCFSSSSGAVLFAGK